MLLDSFDKSSKFFRAAVPIHPLDTSQNVQTAFRAGFRAVSYRRGRMGDMSKKSRWLYGCLAGAALTLGAVSGCQTQLAGMTLPSGHYLEHPPQFIPQSPDFPLRRELVRQEETAVAPPVGGPIGPPAGGVPLPLPRQVPPGGPGVP
jgi:hypothetical protein